jgi:excisionase family DNA binding protein
MSSTIQVQRICQHCGNEFTARTTVTQYCSHECSRRAYKAKARGIKVEASKQETQRIRTQPMEVLKAREFLSVQQVSKLIGCSRQTVYELINSGKLHAVNLKEKKTIVRRSDIDRLFDQPFVSKPKKEPQPVSEFYTAKEIEEKYFVKYGRLNNIIKENDIPKTVHNGKLLVSKPHIDRYFKQTRSDVSSITEWYTVEEIQHKYSISRDQIYGRVYDNSIPKQRVGKYVKISKKHFDELFEIGV